MMMTPLPLSKVMGAFQVTAPSVSPPYPDVLPMVMPVQAL